MIDRLKAHWAALTLIGAILAAGAGGATYATGLRQEVAENTTWRLIQTFEQLDAARKHRRLTPIEWQRWCLAGRQLRVFTTCPAR